MLKTPQRQSCEQPGEGKSFSTGLHAINLDHPPGSADNTSFLMPESLATNTSVDDNASFNRGASLSMENQ
ncbi:hypothetical protein PoB_002447300 [Plakobranchus ocellatus]|uniref:Uncharacterized protein n=1 Tax=Plakobranchus ocellatus TaxID=259542 RepID=A0AAV3ZSZ7_9GAST|nr:hypothetical protein PoB_002447300 [Plakobranchus ocellatus]